MLTVRTISSTFLATVVWLVIGVCGATAIKAEIQGATRTVFLDFQPTLIGNQNIERAFVGNLSGSATYRIDLPSESPFVFIGNANDLVVRFGFIWVDVSFRPFEEGRSTGVMRLVREPQIGQDDTILIKMSAEGYRVARTEILDFGRVNTGDTVHRQVWVPWNMTDNEAWRIDDVDEPVFELTTKTRPIGFGDSLFFNFRFAPLRGGSYADTVGLVRSVNGTDIDTIIVYLYATGVDFNVRTTIDYQTMVTGDSVVRVVTFPAPTPGNSRYLLVHRPSRPYVLQLISNEPTPKPPDSSMIGVAFVPTYKVTKTDSVILVRVNLKDEPLDTIKIMLTGTGGGLPLEAGADIVDATIGEHHSVSVEAIMNGRPQTAYFSYELVPLNDGPVTGSLTSPTDPARNQVITCGFTTTPTEFRNVTQTWVLRRHSTTITRQWDSTIITVRQFMKARPIQLRMGWSEDTMRKRIGDTVGVNLVLITDDPIDVPIMLSSVVGTVRYNATVIVPLEGSGIERSIVDDHAEITFRFDGPISVSSKTTVIGTIRYVVTLGDADHSPLDMQRAVIVRGQGSNEDIATADAHVIVTNIWRYPGGGSRLVNPSIGPLVMDVDPNPVASNGTLRVTDVPSGEGALQIVDAMGQIVADLTSDLRAGITSWSISTGEGGVLSLGPGTYYARLLVQGSSPKALNSLVRLFVVQ